MEKNYEDYVFFFLCFERTIIIDLTFFAKELILRNGIRRLNYNQIFNHVIFYCQVMCVEAVHVDVLIFFFQLIF